MKNLFLLGDNKYYTIKKLKQQIKDFNALDSKNRKLEIIQSLRYPTREREVRSFLGHAVFYQRFIKDFSKIALPLCKLLQKDVAFEFDEECKKAYDKLKRIVDFYSRYPNPGLECSFRENVRRK